MQAPHSFTRPASPDIPEEDAYTVSPFPDFDDSEKVQQYIRDRRVIGVRLALQTVPTDP